MMAFENRSGMMVLNSEAQLYQLDIAMGKSTFNAKKTAAARGHSVGEAVKLAFPSRLRDSQISSMRTRFVLI